MRIFIVIGALLGGFFMFSGTKAQTPTPTPTPLPCTYVGVPACKFVRDQFIAGLAAGNAGDYYHNADEGHAAATVGPGSALPQVTALPRTRGAVFSVFPGKAVVGNASLAYTGYPSSCSMTRCSFMDGQYGADTVYKQYRANHAYWYPEHRDHDLVDLYPGMTPAVSNSQGSSGSEVGEVRNFFLMMAAFRPEVKTKLVAEGLLMPTMQMIMRRARVATDEEYYTSTAAHRNAYEGTVSVQSGYGTYALPEAQLANRITLGEIPPFAQLEVLSDSYLGIRGRDYFDGSSPVLYDTPVSVARVWRTFAPTQHMVLSAAKSFDVNGRTLTYRWEVVRGDPTHVRITPLDGAGRTVRVDLDYHVGAPIGGPGDRTSNLVVVGLFVHNGAYASPPAFFTSYTLPNQQRTYNAQGRIQEISYSKAPAPNEVVLNPTWVKDVFNYDAGGELTGWTRHTTTTTYDFVPGGMLVLSRNPNGTPATVQQVNYFNNISTYALGWTRFGALIPYTDTQPPTIIGLQASDITQTTALVAWTTDEPALSWVEYGTLSEPARLQQVNFSAMTSHSVRLAVAPATTYIYRVRSCDAVGNCTLSEAQSFTTPSGSGATPTPTPTPTSGSGATPTPTPEALPTPTPTSGAGGAGCMDPIVPGGWAMPCPVFTTMQGVDTLTLQSTPITGTAAHYTYNVVYVYEAVNACPNGAVKVAGGWCPYLFPGPYEANAYLPRNTGGSFTIPLAGFSPGTHYLALWDWTWNANANGGQGCYEGPGLGQCNTGMWRYRTFGAL